LSFRAFSDREQLAQWWGQKGLRNTFHEFDLRPGGRWRFIMHDLDGTDHKDESVFFEVVEPKRIVFQHLDPVHNFQMTMIFADEAGKTRLTWRQRFESAEHCNQVKPFVIEANEQNLDRLEAELAKMT
jgi:uncharacterized protein YndB with AHSA1/START domain